MNRRSLLLSVGGAVIASSCASTSSPTAAREARLAPEIDAAVAQALAHNFTPGLAVAARMPDGSYARAFGVSDVQTGQRVNADTSFYIASSTKPLTALALAILHDRGELDLDSSLSAYAPQASFLPDVRPGEVRLRQLLSHTHGLENGPIAYRSAFTGQHDPETLWRLLAGTTVNGNAPLGQFDYTNVGYNIATLMTDRRVGAPWQDLLAREVFDRIGMTNTSARMSTAVRRGWLVAKPHEQGPGGSERIYLEKTDQTMHSAGGVIMSANDALRWLELLVGGGRVGGAQVVSPDVIGATRERLIESSSESGPFQRTGYGLGWHHGPFRDALMLSHFGSFAGSAAHVSHIPAAGLGVAVFANDSRAGLIVAHAIANYVYGRVAGQADARHDFDAALADGEAMRERYLQSVASDRANRARREWTLTRARSDYVGAYESESWGRIEVETASGNLNIRYGALRAVAEPFTQPDSVRVEFVPGQGEPMSFVGQGAQPESIRTRNGVFRRV